jgi:2-keto-4-pentenoate hydratase/2-oxohepta-3-ene-1,7-dioic acid hydratase in catechol pathway
MLKKGDILFTGTPAGVGKVSPNDYLSGMLEGETLFEINVR